MPGADGFAASASGVGGVSKRTASNSFCGAGRRQAGNFLSAM